MGKIKPFRLQRGTRVGSYRIDKPLGRGWEGEVYVVKEVPTDAVRAMKLFRVKEQMEEKKRDIRDFVATAWFFEQLRDTGSVARYYHCGQWFFEDDEGVFYLVFEKLAGETLDKYILYPARVEILQSPPCPTYQGGRVSRCDPRSGLRSR